MLTGSWPLPRTDRSAPTRGRGTQRQYRVSLRAFTLTELLTTLAIAVLAMFVAMPAGQAVYRGVTDRASPAHEAARRTAAFLDMARRRAMAEHTAYSVVLERPVGDGPAGPAARHTADQREEYLRRRHTAWLAVHKRGADGGETLVATGNRLELGRRCAWFGLAAWGPDAAGAGGFVWEGFRPGGAAAGSGRLRLTFLASGESLFYPPARPGESAPDALPSGPGGAWRGTTDGYWVLAVARAEPASGAFAPDEILYIGLHRLTGEILIKTHAEARGE